MNRGSGQARKVLLIAFRFPPVNAIGAVRMGKFAKYLPECGWEPFVLTVNRPRKELQQTLPQEVDESRVTRTRHIKELTSYAARVVSGDIATVARQDNALVAAGPLWKRALTKIVIMMRPLYSLPLVQLALSEPMGWYPFAVRKGIDVVRREEIDLIYSSFPPSVTHLVAARIAKKTQVPWIAEFRDPWTESPYTSKAQPFHWLEQRLEKRVLRGSSLLVDLGEPSSLILGKLHAKKVAVIPNGFDEADYSTGTPPTSTFTMTYTGGITPGRRDPSPLFQAMESLKNEGKIMPGDIEIRFFGPNVQASISPLVERYSLQGFVQLNDAVPFNESILRQKESTSLLLLEWNDKSANNTFTGKVFEYLGAGRPILAIAYPTGEIDRLLKKTGAGILTTDVTRLKEILATWLEEFSRSGEISSYYEPKPEAIALYSRKTQARTLARVFNDCVRNA